MTKIKHDVILNVSDLKPYQRNAKKHPPKQIKAVADSIKKLGWWQPVVIDKNNIIVIGHCRIEAAKQLGFTEVRLGITHAVPGDKFVPALRAEDLTENQIKALRLADNKLNESPWDMALVKAEISELPFEMQQLTGFPEALGVIPSDADDKVPAIPEKPKTQPGDLYQLGKHYLLCGDATNDEHVDRLMQGKKADMVFTDPPYNIDYTGKTKDALKIQNDKKDDASFLQFLRDCFSNMAAVVKKGAAVYVCHADSEGLNFRTAFKDAGFLMKQCLIWNKNMMVIGRQDYQWKHEPILYGWLDGGAHQFYGGRNQYTVWDVTKPTKSEDHPTMKPVELVTRALVNSSKEEDIILDLFGGSGSTLIACEKINRACYTMELDPKYVDVILKRWSEYTGKQPKKL